MTRTAVITAEHRNRSARRRAILSRVLQYTLLTALAAFFLFPFALMVSRSVMPEHLIVQGYLFHYDLDFSHYYDLVYGENNYLVYFWNTLKIVAFNVIAMPLASSFCAYSFARLRWKGRELVFGAVLATVMVPGVVTQIPLYILFSKMGWLNTAYPLTIPNLFGGGAINIFLFRQFMRGIPREIDEAAKIDGANAFQRYLLLTLPLCVPILLFVAVGAFSSSWSDYFSPLFYFTDNGEAKWTLAIAVYKNLVARGSDSAGARMAAGTFMAVLPALIFFLFQHKLIDGIMVGSVKG